MARLLALEWDSDEARVVTARTQGTELTIESAFAVLWQRQPALADSSAPADVSGQIAAALAERHISRCETLVAVGRAGAELRALSLPPVPEEELPELVRFQAMREFSQLQEDWPLDFVPLPGSDAEKNEVLAATVPANTVSAMRVPVVASHNELKRLVLRPCATASLVCRQTSDSGQGISLIIGRLADSAELAIVVDQAVVFMRSFRLPTNWQPGESGEPLVGEVRRTIAAAQNQLGGARVQRVFLCGADQRALQSRLQTVTGLPVEQCDPFDGLRLAADLQQSRPDNPERYAALLGMLADEAAGIRPAVDFLNPRRKPVPASRRPVYVMSALAVACLVLAVGGLIMYRFSQLDGRIRDLRSQLSQLTTENKQHQQAIDDLQQLQFWQSADINWLEEFRHVAEKLPPPEKAKIELVQATGREGEGGRLVISGLVDDRSSLRELESNLGDDRHLVMPRGDNADNRDPRYRWQFNDTILISRPTASGPRTIDKPADQAAASDTADTADGADTTDAAETDTSEPQRTAAPNSEGTS